MNYLGRCYCAAIEFRVEGAARDVSLCHCRDCQRHAGAPVVAWAGFAEVQLLITRGAPKTIQLNDAAQRQFCGDCGTGLFYRNAELVPGMVEIQSVLFDDPQALAPTMQLQTAERVPWMMRVHELPAYPRFVEQS